MKLLIDLQGAQTESAFRGIGRYSIELTRAMVKQRGSNEVILCLNGHFPESIEHIRNTFFNDLPVESFKVWYSPGPVLAADESNSPRREVAERLREVFIDQASADAVLVTSLFEGLGDNAVTSVNKSGRSTPTAVILYDLIPLISPDENFRTSRLHMNWYADKIDSLKRSSLLLAISKSSEIEALHGLGKSCPQVATISGGCDSRFRRLAMSEEDKRACMRRNGISKPFVMYTGGADERKNLPRLLRAFARLPEPVRTQHELALIGKMQPSIVNDLKALAESEGISTQVVIPGYVTDADLVRLYNCCEVLAFPSLHEGLGLPPLEAMACGAPVIAANATSLPEVVGLEEALFEPTSIEGIADKLHQVLTDQAFRSRLIAHGDKQTLEFSWDTVAREAWKNLHTIARQQPSTLSKGNIRYQRTTRFSSTVKRILVQKLDHRGDLLLAVPAIARLKSRYPGSRIVGLIGSWNVEMARALELFDEVHTLDFFRGASATAPSLSTEQIKRSIQQLGYFDIALDLRRQPDTRFILIMVEAALRAGYETFQPAIDGDITVKLQGYADIPFKTTLLNRTHITEQMTRIVDALPSSSQDYIQLPTLGSRVPPFVERHVGIFPSAGNDVKQWAPDRFVRLAQRLIEQHHVTVINIYFGSETEARNFPLVPHSSIRVHTGLSFQDLVTSLKSNAVCVANNSFGAHIAGYLGCGIVGIYGGQETVAEWSPPFGRSVIVSVDKHCSPCHIGSRRECLYDLACLNDIGVEDVRSAVVDLLAEQESLSPVRIESTDVVMDKPNLDLTAVIGEVVRHAATGWTIGEKGDLARCIAANARPQGQHQQLLVDVTELAKADSGTGIQRVTRSILRAIIQSPPEGFVVEAVTAVNGPNGCFRYARSYKSKLTGTSLAEGEDSIVEAWHGDIFLGLDLNLAFCDAHWQQLQSWRLSSVKVNFVVYDLLPILRSSNFDPGLVVAFRRWLGRAATFDGLLAISKSVESELKEWLGNFGPDRRYPLRTGWFHLGSDIASSAPSMGIDKGNERLFEAMVERPTFLMVGTVEPRKGYGLAVEALTHAWKDEINCNLVICGKEGWRVDDLTNILRKHPQLHKRLFWLEKASDEMLESLYLKASALLAASEAEGFGLPIVEAAARRLAVIARDIPVFREVAGTGAAYFAAESTPKELSGCLKEWIRQYRAGEHPRPESAISISWQQSADQLVKRIIHGNWPSQWLGQRGLRLSALDERLHVTVASRKVATSIESTGVGGNLMFGPYEGLAAGEYAVKIWGQTALQSAPERLWFDVVYESGFHEILKAEIQTHPGQRWNVESTFIVTQAIRDLEVRAFSDPGVMVSIEGLSILHHNSLEP